MKKYVSCFLFFLFLTGGCLLVLFFITRSLETDETQVRESVEQPVFAETSEADESSGLVKIAEITAAAAEEEPEYHIVLNQASVDSTLQADGPAGDFSDDKYCLMSEEGYLIVYDRVSDDVSMFTHMPLTDFPVEEQERLVEGIWFGTMAEIFSYLESYTS